MLVNKGRRQRGGDGVSFSLCQQCGRHKPDGQTPKSAARWDQEHARRCNGTVYTYDLGYEFSADCMVLALASEFMAGGDDKQHHRFLRTLGTALVRGAVERLEIEEDEIAFFIAGNDNRARLVFYETVPGGAGYLEELARDMQGWAQSAHERLFNHDCAGACYRCLKSYRNQFFHRELDKFTIADTLFQLQHGAAIGDPSPIQEDRAPVALRAWQEQENQPTPTRDTAIERALLAAMQSLPDLPASVAQYEIRRAGGALITVPDFAFPDQKLAVFCDGYAYHGDRETLERDAAKRNEIQSLGWRVMVFWGRTILKHPEVCARQIRALLKAQQNEIRTI